MNSLEEGRYVRAYAHFAKPLRQLYSSHSYSVGSVVLILFNLHMFDTHATLSNDELASSIRDKYWLTPQMLRVGETFAWASMARSELVVQFPPCLPDR